MKFSLHYVSITFFFIEIESPPKHYLLLGIQVIQVQELKVILQKESKSMRRRHIFSLLVCGQCNGIVCGSRKAIDSPVKDWL